MRRSLLRNTVLPIDRETDILVKVLAPNSQINSMTLTGVDVVIKEEVSGTILWSCQGEGSLLSGTILTLSGTDIDIRVTAKRMKNISFRYSISDVKRFRVDQKCDLNNCFSENNFLKTVSDFNVDNIENLGKLFFRCSSLEYIEPFYIKDKAKVNQAFYECTKITTCPILNLEVASNIADVLSWSGLNNLDNISGKTLAATIVGSPFANTFLPTLSNLTFSEADEVSLTYNKVATTISNITFSKATKIYMWQSPELVTITDITAPKAIQLIFSDNYKLTTVTNFSVSPTGLVTANNMFLNCGSLVSVPPFNYSEVINASYMFSSCSSLTDLSNLNPRFLRNADRMFDWCTGLTSIPNINYSAITQSESMFANCGNIEGEVNITFGESTSAGYLFQNCKKITKVNLTFQGSTTVSLYTSFYSCTELTDVDIKIINSPQYTLNMNSAFYGCTKLVNVSLPPNSTSTDYLEAFYNCTSLTSIPLGFGSVGDFRKTFYGCTSLTEVKNRSFKSLLFSSYQYQMASLEQTFAQSGVVTAENLTFTGGVTGGYEPNYFNINNLFVGCSNLENVSNITFDTGGNKNVIYTINPNFNSCPKLTTHTPVTVNNTGEIQHLRSYNTTNYEGIVSYNNDVSLSWADSCVEFYNNPTVKTINFAIDLKANPTVYGDTGIAGFSNCPELESLTITNPNNLMLQGVNVYNGNWYTWIPFLENLPKLTYLKIVGLSWTTILPSNITDISIIEQIIDDLADVTGQFNQRYLTIGDARKALVDPAKITAAENKNWIIQ